jgi:hypothetical protein
MHRRIQVGGGRLLAAVIFFALLAPASALAAAPGVTNGPAANKGQTSATLTGKVDPNGSQTTYFFEYGTTKLYGSRTPDASAGSGNNNVAVAANIGGLAPATTYHYRLVAFHSANVVSRSGDRTFKTQRQPLGISLNAAPNPVHRNGKTMISGVLSGTGNGDRRIVLQQNPFPYTQGFQTISDVHLTNANGSFFFPVLGVPVNTQYRVVLTNVPEVASPIVTVGVEPKVTLSSKRLSGNRFRFKGKITPAHDGAGILIQRLKNGAWTTVARSHARAARGDVSKYSKRFRIKHSGTYRVFAATDNGANTDSASRTIHLKRR